jgi:protein subunit release factor A
MKRKLTEEEEKLAKKGLIVSEKKLKELEENKRYNQSLLDKQKYLRKHEDDWRDYLRNKKDHEDAEVLKSLDEEIDLTKFKIKTAIQQLREGVEVKQPSGVE